MTICQPFFARPSVVTAPRWGFGAIVTAALVCGCGVNSPLGRAQENCNKLPTPDARVACIKQGKDEGAAYRAYLETEKKRAKEAKAAQEDATPKKDSLCFKRTTTGETLCPN